LRARLLASLARVTATQEDLLAMLIDLAHEHDRTEQDTVCWEECLDLAATIKTQVHLLRSQLQHHSAAHRAPQRASRSAQAAPASLPLAPDA
jgi:gentisate 1,2-dioxygenase